MKSIKNQISKALLVTLLLSGGPLGAIAAGPSADDTLLKMEDNLFGHSYVGESDESRVGRLERLVFGEVRTGAVADRIATLKSAAAGAGSTPPNVAETEPSQTESPQPEPPQPEPPQPVQSQAPQPAPQRTETGGNGSSGDVSDAQTKGGGEAYATPGYGNYPRVTELEQQLLGKTYVSEPLPERVKRLEVKQFGKASTGDVCDRLDKLDQFLKPKTPIADQDQGDSYPQDAGTTPQPAPGNVPGSAQSASGYVATASPAAASGSGTTTQYSASDYGSYPRVNELEEQFLGQKYLSDPLPVRIARLETKEFKKTFSDESLCDRIDRLDQHANPKKKQQQQQQQQQTADQDGTSNGSSNSNNGRGSIGGAIGKTLLGLMGGGMGGPLMGGGVMGGGMGPGMMMGPGMFGMGPGMMMGSGMGRGGRGGRNAQQTNPAPQVAQAPVIQNPFAPGADPVTGLEERTGAMERFVFGHEQSKLSTEERVQRLEKRLVPYEHHTQTEDLNHRVDHLWTMLAAANRQQRKTAAAPAATPN